MTRGRPRHRVFTAIAAQVAALRAAGTPVVLVSSGAIALGLGTLGRTARPGRLHELQAASAVGQAVLQRRWESALRKHGAAAAQVLLTSGDVHRRDGYVNARGTLETLLRWQMVPVVNENDSTATDEITFGDNDALAAQVAVLLRARLLLLLTDTDGLYDRDPAKPGAQRLDDVTDHTMLQRLDLRRGATRWGSGGMRSKVVAAEMARSGGVAVVIAHGAHAGRGRRRGRPAVRSARASAPIPARCRPTSCGCATESRCAGRVRGRRRSPAGGVQPGHEPAGGGGHRRRRERSPRATRSSSPAPTKSRSRWASQSRSAADVRAADGGTWRR